MEKLQKVLDTYKRYLDSLTNKETDVKKNYAAMKAVTERDAAPWLKKHMLQDCFINSLRFNRSKFQEIEPSTRIKKLMDASSDGTKLLAEVENVKLSLQADGAEGFTWLPTLYTYFRPTTRFELQTMGTELEQMHNIGLCSERDFKCVKENVFLPKLEQFTLKEKQETKYSNQEELELALQ